MAVKRRSAARSFSPSGRTTAYLSPALLLPPGSCCFASCFTAATSCFTGFTYSIPLPRASILLPPALHASKPSERPFSIFCIIVFSFFFSHAFFSHAASAACEQAFGACEKKNEKKACQQSVDTERNEAAAGGGGYVTPLREFLGAVGALEWRRKGVYVPALSAAIYPHYGVFSPVYQLLYSFTNSSTSFTICFTRKGVCVILNRPL
jgi:hypothetical protein